MMVNFVAIAEHEGNEWLKDLNINKINRTLAKRQQRVEKMLATNEWYSLSSTEKKMLSPEVYRLDWVNIEDCVKSMQNAIGNTLINDWQREQFKKHKIPKRSPVNVSM